MKLGSFVLLALVAISNVSFGDMIMPGNKVLDTDVVVTGLDSDGKTKDGSVLVVLNQMGRKGTVHAVENGKPLYKGYKFSQNTVYFVSADLLNSVHGNLSAINYSNTRQAGLTVAPIQVVQPTQIPSGSPLKSRTVTYTVE